MTISIKLLRGVDVDLAGKLKGLGLTDSAKFLAATRTPAGRKDVAEKAGISTDLVLELANRADLSRVKGIAQVYSDLLENAGVDTVAELAHRRADNLTAKLAEINAAQKLSKRTPPMSFVEDWIAQAKALGHGLEY
jgi:predicted flap endonuclease-1-like 5' DNA nuclease